MAWSRATNRFPSPGSWTDGAAPRPQLCGPHQPGSVTGGFLISHFPNHGNAPPGRVLNGLRGFNLTRQAGRDTRHVRIDPCHLLHWGWLRLARGRPPRRVYQLIFSASWNCLGSSAAVGWPARQADGLVGSQSGFTSATLNRLNMLNPSAMNSTFHFSLG